MNCRLVCTGIHVRNPERPLASSSKALGMKESPRGRVTHGAVLVLPTAPGSSHRLELNRYPRDTPFYAPYARREELDRIAFPCRGVRAELRRLARARASAAVPPWDEDGYVLAYVKDPDAIGMALLGRAWK